jgi:hypothetical protein
MKIEKFRGVEFLAVQISIMTHEVIDELLFIYLRPRCFCLDLPRPG